jgi:hypothetical protein
LRLSILLGLCKRDGHHTKDIRLSICDTKPSDSVLSLKKRVMPGPAFARSVFSLPIRRSLPGDSALLLNNRSAVFYKNCS